MTNPDELRRRFERPSARGLVTVVGVLAALVLVAALCARPVWSLIKAARARHFVGAGERLLADQQYVLALERGRSALQLTPANPDALRLCARVLGVLHGEASLPFWRRLVDQGAATSEDRAAFVERALTLERADLVQDLVPTVISAQPASARTDRLGALFCLQVGRLADAVERARSACRSEPANPTNTLLLADILLAARPAGSGDEARGLYWQVASNHAGLRPRALRRLGWPPFGSRGDRERLVDLLDVQTNRTATEDVLLAEARLQLDPSDTARVISNLVSRIPRDDTERLSAVAETLQRLGHHREVLQLTGGGRETLSREIFLARLGALTATSQFEEAYRLTLQKGIPLPPYDLELVRTEAAQRTGDTHRRDTHLKELLRAAGVHPARLRTAAEMAEALDAPEVATAGWKILSQQPSEATNAWRRLQRLVDRSGDTWSARDYARRALRVGDRDPALHLEIAYYDLLLNDSPDRALAEAERQLESRPNNFFARAVVALGHLRLGEPDRARAVLDRFTVEPSELRSDALAVLTAVYGANGLTNRAVALAARIPLAGIRPEERDLIRPWVLSAPFEPGRNTHPDR